MNLYPTWIKGSPYKDEVTARNLLITEYLPFVKRVVQRIAVHLPSYVDKNDLYHAGIIGLIQSIDRYDSHRGSSLATYALFRIRGAILSELRTMDFLSRKNRKNVREMQKTSIRLEQKLGREIENWELAEEMGVTMNELENIQRIACLSIVSFDDIISESNTEKDFFIEQLVNNQDHDAFTSVRAQEIKSVIANAIEVLPEKEKHVISLYYVDELTFKEIGKVMNLTESRISQIHEKAILALQKILIKNGMTDN